MIIVSQDKNIVVNFDNVANINIEKCYNESIREEDFTFDILVFIVSSGLVRIGKYKTQERAKEVLQEIISAFSDFEYFKSTEESNKENIGIKIFANYGTIDVYKMPEE